MSQLFDCGSTRLLMLRLACTADHMTAYAGSSVPHPPAQYFAGELSAALAWRLAPTVSSAHHALRKEYDGTKWSCRAARGDADCGRPATGLLRGGLFRLAVPRQHPGGRQRSRCRAFLDMPAPQLTFTIIIYGQALRNRCVDNTTGISAWMPCSWLADIVCPRGALHSSGARTPVNPCTLLQVCAQMAAAAW